MKTLFALYFSQVRPTYFLIIIMVIRSLKMLGLAMIFRKDLKKDYHMILVALAKMKLGMQVLIWTTV